jgi:hypothetical protein
MEAYNYDKDDLNNAILSVRERGARRRTRGDECRCPYDP